MDVIISPSALARILPLGVNKVGIDFHEPQSLLQIRVPRNCNSAAQPSVGREAKQHMTILGWFFQPFFIEMELLAFMHQGINRYTKKVLFILISSLYVL